MFIMFLILSIASAGLFAYLANSGRTNFTGLTFVAAVILLFTTAVIHFDSVAVGKVETLKSVGMEPLSKSQVYEMSRKELDKCKKICTFEKTYYFVVEEK